MSNEKSRLASLDQSVKPTKPNKPTKPTKSVKTFQSSHTFITWQTISNLIESYWSEPDLEGVWIVACFIAAYRLHEPDPFWLSLIGASSGSKTALGMFPLTNCGWKDAHDISSISSKAFMSGYNPIERRATDKPKNRTKNHTEKTEKANPTNPANSIISDASAPSVKRTKLSMLPTANLANLTNSANLVSDRDLNNAVKSFSLASSASFLHRLGTKGIIYSKEFGTVLASHPNELNAIAAQLREIYDGSMTLVSGGGAGTIKWKGRVSMITAYTPSKEAAWFELSGEGDRFLILRWDGAQQDNDSSLVPKILSTLGAIMNQQNSAAQSKGWEVHAAQSNLEANRHVISGDDSTSIANQLNDLCSQTDRVTFSKNSKHNLSDTTSAPNESNSIPASASAAPAPEYVMKLSAAFRELFDSPIFPLTQPTIPSDALRWEVTTRLAQAVEILIRARVSPRRIGGELSFLTGFEGSGRVLNALFKAIRGNAALYRRQFITPDDYAVAFRLVYDSIPLTKLDILNNLPFSVSISTTALFTKVRHESLKFLSHDLQVLTAVGLVERTNHDKATAYSEHTEWKATQRWVEFLRDNYEDQYTKFMLDDMLWKTEKAAQTEKLLSIVEHIEQRDGKHKGEKLTKLKQMANKSALANTTLGEIESIRIPTTPLNPLTPPLRSVVVTRPPTPPKQPLTKLDLLNKKAND